MEDMRGDETRSALASLSMDLCAPSMGASLLMG